MGRVRLSEYYLVQKKGYFESSPLPLSPPPSAKSANPHGDCGAMASLGQLARRRAGVATVQHKKLEDVVARPRWGRVARQCPAPDRGSGQLQRNSRMKKTRDWLQLSRTSILPYARTPLRPARYASRVFFGILLRATDHCRTSHSGVGTTRVTSMAHPSSRSSHHRSACVFLCSRMKNTHGPYT